MPGSAQIAQHIGVDKIGGHLGQAQRHLFGGNPFALVTRRERPPIAVRIELRHRTASIQADRIGGHPVGDHLPIQTQIAQGITRRIQRHLQAARMIPRRIQRLWLKPGWQLSGCFCREIAAILHVHLARLLNRDPHRFVIQRVNAPAFRQEIRQVAPRQVKANGTVARTQRQFAIPDRIGRIKILGFKFAHQRMRLDITLHLSRDIALNIHDRSQAAPRLLRCGLIQGVNDHPAITMMA